MIGRYYFTILDGKPIVDTAGVVCATWNDVRAQAIGTAGECLRDLGADYPDGLEWELVVTNEDADPVMRLRFTVSESE